MAFCDTFILTTYSAEIFQKRKTKEYEVTLFLLKNVYYTIQYNIKSVYIGYDNNGHQIFS